MRYAYFYGIVNVTIYRPRKDSRENKKYAAEIAGQWNVKYNSDHKGYVTKFEIDDEYFQQFEVHIVDGDYHQELWVPAEELETFNQHIIETIQVIQTFSEK